MPQEPKKRHSRQRQGKRRAAIHLAVSKTVTCANCSKQILAHRACKYCGFYKGKEIISKKSKIKDKKNEEAKEK
jgi:large subunit ribosomal protein L32